MLDSEIMLHHAIDKERVCNMYDIIRGRHYRGRKQEGMEMEMEEEEEKDDSSPFQFERGENQIVSP